MATVCGKRKSMDGPPMNLPFSKRARLNDGSWYGTGCTVNQNLIDNLFGFVEPKFSKNAIDDFMTIVNKRESDDDRKEDMDLNHHHCTVHSSPNKAKRTKIYLTPEAREFIGNMNDHQNAGYGFLDGMEWFDNHEAF